MSGPKIVATIGPKTATADALKALCSAGMDIARLNGSHSDIEWHRKTAALIRKIDSNVPILLDLPGGKIRTSKLVQEFSVAPGQQVIFSSLQAGQNGQPSHPEAGAPLDSSARDRVGMPSLRSRSSLAPAFVSRSSTRPRLSATPSRVRL